MLEFRNHYYMIEIKDILDAANPIFWYLIHFFIKKTNSTNTCFRAFTSKSNQAKNSKKKKTLLIGKILLELKTEVISITLHYINDRKKLNNIIY